MRTQAVCGNTTVSAYLVTSTWTESTITYANRPASSSTATSSATIDTSHSNTWFEWDVTIDVSNGNAANGWRMHTPDSSANLGFSSKEDALPGNPGSIGIYSPQLVITYAPDFSLPEYGLGAFAAIAACFVTFFVVKKPWTNLKRK